MLKLKQYKQINFGIINIVADGIFPFIHEICLQFCSICTIHE